MNAIKNKIVKMLEQDAFSFSDIHIEVGSPIRVRIPRGLIPVDDDDVTQPQLLEFLGAFGDESVESWQKKIDEGDGQYSALFDVHGVNMRAALFNCGGLISGKQRRWGLSMRVLPRDIPAFESLGIPADFKNLYRRENGIIFITGVTGSGKTTTAAAAINDLNENMPHRIITLEDPLEYVHVSKKSMITQRQLGVDFKDFQSGVKQAMRQDPNVIVVGEVNDIHSLRGAISAANSGHLVITTMHTLSAIQTVDRVIDLYPEAEKAIIRGMFAQLLIAVVAQKLVPSIDGSRYYLAHEIMENSTAVASIIREGVTERLTNELDKKQPLLHLMNTTLAELVADGKITGEKAREATYDAEGLDREMGRDLADA